MLERAMLAEMASEWKELRCLYPIPFHVLFLIFFFLMLRTNYFLLWKKHLCKKIEEHVSFRWDQFTSSFYNFIN